MRLSEFVFENEDRRVFVTLLGTIYTANGQDCAIRIRRLGRNTKYRVSNKQEFYNLVIQIHIDLTGRSGTHGDRAPIEAVLQWMTGGYIE